MIGYHESADHITLSYRLPASPFAPMALLWSLIGGLAVGAGLAIVLVAAGIGIDIEKGWTAFRLVLLGGTILSALIIYGLGYFARLRRFALLTTFDYRQNRLVIKAPGAPRQRIGFEDARGFEVVDNEDQQLTLATTFNTLTLLTLPHSKNSQLQNYAGRLNSHLAAVHTVPDETQKIAAVRV
jgi:hypothetical protein